MFGFKSKKDKRIEELERLLYEKPIFYQQNVQIETITTRQLIDDPRLPIDLVKGEIAREMIERLKDNIHFEVSQDPETQYIVLRGTLHYVPIMNFSRK